MGKRSILAQEKRTDEEGLPGPIRKVYSHGQTVKVVQKKCTEMERSSSPAPISQVTDSQRVLLAQEKNF
jgi:hypothetical protein